LINSVGHPQTLSQLVLHTLVVHELKQSDWLQLVSQLFALQLTLLVQLFDVLQLVSQLSAIASAGTKSASDKNIRESCFINTPFK
jgi:hypothetical protein